MFKDFIETFSTMRGIDKKNNTICKFIINSVYGRLGMSEITTETRFFNIERYEIFRKKNEERIVRENWVNKIVFVEYERKKKTESLNSNVILAAAITSKARVKLYKGFKSVIKGGGRILYCDTDSIFAAFNRNVDNLRFGEVFFDTMVKNTKLSKSIFALPKAYSIVNEGGEQTTKIKGFDTVKISFEKFKGIFMLEKKESVLMSTLRKANFIVTPEIIEKEIFLGNYNKRTFDLKKIETVALWSDKDGCISDLKSDENQKNDEFEGFCNSNKIEKLIPDGDRRLVQMHEGEVHIQNEKEL